MTDVDGFCLCFDDGDLSLLVTGQITNSCKSELMRQVEERIKTTCVVK